MNNYKEILPFWVSVPNILRRPNKVYRMDGGDNRYYLTINEYHQVEFFPSVTSIIAATTPTPPYLVKWMCDHGKQRAEELRRQKAEYGTLMHIVIGMYLTVDNYNLDILPAYVAHYCAEHRFDFDTAHWADDLQHDMLAFHQFCEDYQVEPVAIEMPLTNSEAGYWFGGAIDLVCHATIEEKGFFGEVYKSGEKKGLPKETTQERRTTIIVDFKSGRHGFYESNEIQANMYLRMWNNAFPEHKAEFCYNWRPKDWDIIPSYEVKDQTNRDSARQIPLLVQLFALREKPAPSGRTVISGTISRGRALTGDNVAFRSAEQIALDMHANTEPWATSQDREQWIRGDGQTAEISDAQDANLNEEPSQTFVFDNEHPTPQEQISPTLRELRKEIITNGITANGRY